MSRTVKIGPKPKTPKVTYLRKGGKVSPKSKGSKICPEGKAWAERTFDTYPSAYANLAASKYCKDPNYAKKSKGGKIKGGRFYQGSREDLAAQIKDQIGASAVKTGLKAGLVKLGGKIDIGGAGTIGGKATATTGGSVAAGEQAASGFKFSDIFSGGDKAGAGQTGLGKALDFKGSTLGGYIEGLKAKALQAAATDLSEKSARIDTMLSERGSMDAPQSYMQPTFDEIMSSTTRGPGLTEYGLPGEYKVGQSPIQYDLAEQKSAEISAGLKNYEFGAGSPTGITKGYFEEGDLIDWDAADVTEADVYTGAPQYDEFGAFTGGRHLDPSEALKLRQEQALENMPGRGTFAAEDLYDWEGDIEAAAIKRIPFSGGPGIDETRTSAWEGVGESFPVTSPDIRPRIGSLPELGLQSSNYDLLSESSIRAQELQSNLALRERLGIGGGINTGWQFPSGGKDAGFRPSSAGSQWWKRKFGR